MREWVSPDGRMRLINGDCMDFMRGCRDGEFELAVVDPPYGVNRDKGFGGFGGFGKPIARKQYKGDWDSRPPEKEYFDRLMLVSKESIIWGGNFFTDKLPVSGHWLFWDKLNTMPTFGDGELAYTTIKRKSVKRFVYEYNGLLGKEKDRIHATQKPVALYRWLFQNYAKAGDRILDTHVGSASSFIAAWEKGFEIVGCELDADYFDAAVARIEKAMQQPSLPFATPQPKPQLIEQELF